MSTVGVRTWSFRSENLFLSFQMHPIRTVTGQYLYGTVFGLFIQLMSSLETRLPIGHTTLSRIVDDGYFDYYTIITLFIARSSYHF